MPWVEVFPGRDRQQWYFRVKAANGEVVASSEGYTRHWSAKRAARRVYGADVEIREVED